VKALSYFFLILSLASCGFADSKQANSKPMEPTIDVPKLEVPKELTDGLDKTLLNELVDPKNTSSPVSQLTFGSTYTFARLLPRLFNMGDDDQEVNAIAIGEYWIETGKDRSGNCPLEITEGQYIDRDKDRHPVNMKGKITCRFDGPPMESEFARSKAARKLEIFDFQISDANDNEWLSGYSANLKFYTFFHLNPKFIEVDLKGRAARIPSTNLRSKEGFEKAFQAKTEVKKVGDKFEINIQKELHARSLEGKESKIGAYLDYVITPGKPQERGEDRFFREEDVTTHSMKGFIKFLHEGEMRIFSIEALNPPKDPACSNFQLIRLKDKSGNLLEIHKSDFATEKTCETKFIYNSKVVTKR